MGLTIGPGRFLLGLIPHPQGDVRHAIQFVAGLILIAVAVGLWLGRRRLSRRQFSAGGARRGSSFMAGASIAAVELPTAAPYFAVMTALAASSATVSRQIGLLALYNAAFVAPLLAIAIVVAVAGERGMRWLAVAGAWLRRRWPVVLSALLLLVGGALVILGAVGLVRQ